MGAPTTVAPRITATSGQRQALTDASGTHARPKAAATAARTMARLAQAVAGGYGVAGSVSNSLCGGTSPDCHHIRRAMTAKPTGMIASTHHSGTPPERIVIDCRSVSTVP